MRLAVSQFVIRTTVPRLVRSPSVSNDQVTKTRAVPNSRVDRLSRLRNSA